MLLYDTFGATVRGSPDRIALVCDGKRYRYADIERSVCALAACLQSRGVARGDRVAVFLDNSFEAVVSLYAILRVGAVVMPINPLTRKEKLAYLLDDARASALVTHALLKETWEGAISRSRTVHTCIVAEVDASTARDDRCMSFEHALAMPGEPREVVLVDQDLAALIYTSGSTGEPKGVMLTHLNMLSAARSIVGYLGLRDTDVILCASPLAFDYGLYQVLMGFMVGATVVLERSFAFPVKILETMVRERVTVLPGVPTMFSMLLNIEWIARHDLTSLRMLTNTAAALPETCISDLRNAFPQARLYSMYGVTECKRVSYLPPEELDVRPTSVGRGMPNQEHWLVDDEGRRLPNGSQGELVVRGSHVMRGYWERPEDTARALRPGPLPGERVLYTGDIFRTDAEGYLYFVARKDDIIKSRGEKVSPREVENALYGLDGVSEAAVLGVPDPVLGSAIKAVVALKPGYRYSEREVIRHCLAMLESFMAPKYVEFVEALPKTNNGKIDKKELA
jgi:amino acid adenylation domain-containing protein